MVSLVHNSVVLFVKLTASPFFLAPHFIIFSTRTEDFCWKSIPSWPFTAVVIGTQIIALVLSVYGVVGDSRVEGIGWVRGIIIIAIALVTFVLVDLVKVLTIRLWNRTHSHSNIVKKKPTLSSSITKLKQKKTSRAKKFNEEHNLQWDEGHRAY